MLNKKAIAAFAAGATLLSGLAVAAPALAENAKDGKAPAAATQAAPKADNTEAVNVAKKKLSDAQRAERKAEVALDDANGNLADAKDKDAKIQAEANKVKTADAALEAAKTKAAASLKAAQAVAKDATKTNPSGLEPKDDASDTDKANFFILKNTAVDDAKAVTTATTAKTEAEAAAKAEITKIDKNRTEASSDEQAKASTKAVKEAQTAVYTAQGELNAAKADVKTAQDELDKLVAPAPKPEPKKEDPKKEEPKKEDPKKTDPKKEEPKKEDPKKTDPKKEEPGKVVVPKTKEELKAYVEQVKAALKAEKDAKKAEAVKAALAEFGKAAKAKDKAAFAAALKKLVALVPYTAAKKPEPKPTEPSLVDPKAADLLYTNYQGLFADLAARGVTNVAAYDALLDKLEFGIKQTGWENILKNFGGNNCAYLNGLRRQLQKAVLHYGHVEAAVKDIVAELTEDYNDAKASENWDAAKVIKEKLAKARGLLGVADNNRTRAAALLDSANDHAKDLSCDTGAKEVRDAMDKEPNSPFKPTPAPKPAPKTPKAPKLPNTGAVVALAAVAASVLAGMGAALRKIRH